MLYSVLLTIVVDYIYLFKEIWVNFRCYYSEKLIALNILHEVVPLGTHFTSKSTEAMLIKCLAQ